MAAKKKQYSSGGFTIPKWKEINPDVKSAEVNGTKIDFKRKLNDALFYLHIELEQKQLAQAFQTYMLNFHDKAEVAMLKRVSEIKQAAAGKYAYIVNKGGALTQELVDRLEQEYQTLIAEANTLVEVQEVKKEEKPKAPVISIQERMRQQVEELCGEWEGFFDDMLAGEKSVKVFDPHRDMKVYNGGVVKPAHAKIIKDMYAQQYEEALEIVEWKDAEIKEAYNFLTTAKQRKEVLEFVEKINTACDTFISTGKAQRKTRVKKAPSKEKLVAKLKFKESEASIGLASINPIELIGAQQLWVYNSKTRKLGCYYADSMTGPITVKGTSLIGFDTAKSVQKTVRKPDVLKGANKLARTKFDKLFDDIKTTDSKMNGRLNEHTILVKVF